MNEKEARTKWCPFTRVFDARPDFRFGPYNRLIFEDDDQGEFSNTDRENHCIASDCMMWTGMGSFGHCGLASEK